MSNAAPTKKIHIDKEDIKTVLNYIGPEHWLGQDYMLSSPHDQAKWIRAAMLRSVASVERSNGS